MAQNVIINSVTYQNVPEVDIPKSGPIPYDDVKEDIIAMATEDIGDRKAADTLSEMLLKPGVRFHSMSTYEELMVILTTASLIVMILNMKNKK